MPKTYDLDLDARIEASGGRRRVARDPKSNYEWPGMMAWPDWSRTRVHRHTAYYGCAKCGARFSSPQAVYAHLAKLHPAKGSRPLGARLSPLNGSGRGSGRVSAEVRVP